MSQKPLLTTDRLTLTWPSHEQIEEYYLAIIGTQMFDTIQWDGPSGPEDLHSYWEECRKKDMTDLSNDLSIAIIENESQSYIGGAGLRVAGGNHTQIDIGYALAPKFHGKGYASEAVGALVDEAFKSRKAERVFANIFLGNQASRRVVEKLGFIQEGLLRRVLFKKGQWVDEWLMAITRPDWEALNSKE